MLKKFHQPHRTRLKVSFWELQFKIKYVQPTEKDNVIQRFFDGMFLTRHILDILHHLNLVKEVQCFRSWICFCHQVKSMKPILLDTLQLNSIPGLGRQVSYTYPMTEAEPAKMLYFFKQNKKMENVQYVYKFNYTWWLMCVMFPIAVLVPPFIFPEHEACILFPRKTINLNA